MQRNSLFVQWFTLSALVAAVALSLGRAVADDCNRNGIPDEQDYVSGALHDVSPANGIPDECEGCPLGHTYTAADFDQGVSSASIERNAFGQLQLEPPPALFPFVNVACSARGTVARINVNETDPAKAVVGEYATAPLKLDITGIRYGLMNPSRTTVDHKGNTWVANRDEDSPSPPGSGVNIGSITRIALLLGGTRCNENGTPTTNGQYLKEPFDYCSVGDGPNGDWHALDTKPPFGLIKTSRGLGNILDWANGYPSFQYPDNDGGVSTAEDECIVT